MARNVKNPPATGNEGEAVCGECGVRGGHTEDCSQAVCEECRGVGGHYASCSKNTSTVDGRAATVDTTPRPEAEQTVGFRVEDFEILRTIAKKREQIDAAEKAHEKTKTRLKTLREELDEILENVPGHVHAVEEARHQGDLFDSETDPKCWNERCVRRQHGDDEMHKDANGVEFSAERPPKNVTPDANTIEGEAIAVNKRGQAGGRAPAALPKPQGKARKKRGQTNAEALLVWSEGMEKKFGKADCRDTGAGVRLKWLPALAREIYGTDWKNKVPEEGPTTDAALLRAQRWLDGEWPSWAGK